VFVTVSHFQTTSNLHIGLEHATPEDYTIRFFTNSIIYYKSSSVCYSSLIFAAKAGAYPSGDTCTLL